MYQSEQTPKTNDEEHRPHQKLVEFMSSYCKANHEWAVYLSLNI